MSSQGYVDVDRPTAAPRDPVAVVAGSVAFLIVMAMGAALIVVEFQVAEWIWQSMVWAALGILAATFRFTVPSSRLTPTQLRVREGRRVAVLVGGLGAFASLGLAAAIAELKSGDDWIFLGFLMLTNFGVGAMINTRFSLGKG